MKMPLYLAARFIHPIVRRFAAPPSFQHVNGKLYIKHKSGNIIGGKHTAAPR
jgi:hypothetical protein